MTYTIFMESFLVYVLFSIMCLDVFTAFLRRSFLIPNIRIQYNHHIGLLASDLIVNDGTIIIWRSAEDS